MQSSSLILLLVAACLVNGRLEPEQIEKAKRATRHTLHRIKYADSPTEIADAMISYVEKFLHLRMTPEVTDDIRINMRLVLVHLRKYVAGEVGALSCLDYNDVGNQTFTLVFCRFASLPGGSILDNEMEFATRKAMVFNNAGHKVLLKLLYFVKLEHVEMLLEQIRPAFMMRCRDIQSLLGKYRGFAKCVDVLMTTEELYQAGTIAAEAASMVDFGAREVETYRQFGSRLVTILRSDIPKDQRAFGSIPH